MLLFSQHFLQDTNHLHNSIEISNCCNQAKFLNTEMIMKCPAFEIFARNSLKLLIQKNIIATVRIITIEKPESTFLFTFFPWFDTIV